MDNIRGLLGIRRIDRAQNPQVRELYRVMKGVDERIDEGVLLWFIHVERMENDRIAKSVYVKVLVVAQWVGCGKNRLIW